MRPRPRPPVPRRARLLGALALLLAAPVGLAGGCAALAPSAAPHGEGPPAPAPAAWRELVGVYRLGADTVSVLEREGRLLLLRGGEERALEPEGGDAFRVAGPAGNGRLVFERDARGRTRWAVLGRDTLRPVVAGPEGETGFRITPVRPVEELRREALDPTIRLDVRYATENNFMGARFYTEPRAFLQRPAAEAVVRAHRALMRRGYGVLVHDAYRPWYVTRMFWDATPDSQRVFVADPASGSRHNRGAAVDLSLYDLRTGEPVEMVSGYDEFSPRAYPDYPGGTSRQRWFRALLRRAMEEEGFTVYDAEWWHFDHRDWRSYPILNLTFDQIPVRER